MSKCWVWPPPRRGFRLAVALPGSVIGVEHTLLGKTVKAGLIGRLLAVYRVDVVALFRDPDTEDYDLGLLEILLRYQATPPHLKKKVFGVRRELRYASVMPPLKTPAHTPPESPGPGDVLYGYVERCRGGSCRVYLGRAGRGRVRVDRSLAGEFEGRIVLVRVVEGGAPGSQYRVELLDESEAPFYTMFRVERHSHLEELVENFRSRGFKVVATSKLGECDYSKLRPEGYEGLLIVFGGPWKGLLEYTDPGIYDAVLNTIPIQGTETVRTEEAVSATLSILNILV